MVVLEIVLLTVLEIAREFVKELVHKLVGMHVKILVETPVCGIVQQIVDLVVAQAVSKDVLDVILLVKEAVKALQRVKLVQVVELEAVVLQCASMTVLQIVLVKDVEQFVVSNHRERVKATVV